jgi:transcription factor WhiB
MWPPPPGGRSGLVHPAFRQRPAPRHSTASPALSITSRHNSLLRHTGRVQSQTSVGERARELLLADPGRTSREIAAAGCTRQTVHRMRQRLEAAGLIPVRASRPPPAWRATALPVMPQALARGSCAGHPHPDWWTSASPAERAQAAMVCAGCPVAGPCGEYSLSLPAADTAVWAGLSRSQRLALRRQRRAGPA